jgi:hypothetical protein
VVRSAARVPIFQRTVFRGRMLFASLTRCDANSLFSLTRIGGSVWPRRLNRANPARPFFWPAPPLVAQMSPALSLAGHSESNASHPSHACLARHTCLAPLTLEIGSLVLPGFRIGFARRKLIPCASRKAFSGECLAVASNASDEDENKHDD